MTTDIFIESGLSLDCPLIITCDPALSRDELIAIVELYLPNIKSFVPEASIKGRDK